MANNIYIGNRYVPIFANPVEWDNLREYEPLTIVTYHGTSYTSKKTVPVGTKLDNREYWVVTGNYNQQVEEYRQDVETLSNNLTKEVTARENADKTLTNNLSKEVTDRENADKTLTNNLNNEVTTRKNTDNEIIETIAIRRNTKDIICIGDSYGLNNAGWSGWGYELAKLYHKGNVYVASTGGAGWVNASEGRNFLQTLQFLVNNETSMIKKNITDVVVLGGYNDMVTGLNVNNCTSAMKTFKEYCDTNFPNARVHFGCIGMDYNNATNEYKLLNTYGEDIYPTACSTNGIKYYNRFKYILLDSKYVYIKSGDPNSYYHPNTLGCQQIAKYLYRYLELGNFDVIYGDAVMGSLVYTRNGVTNIMPNDNNSIFSDTDARSKTFPFNTWVEVKNLGNNANNLWGSPTVDLNGGGTPAYGTVKWINFDTGAVQYLKYKLGWHKLYFNNNTKLETFNPSSLPANSGYIIEPITCDELIAI